MVLLDAGALKKMHVFSLIQDWPQKPFSRLVYLLTKRIGPEHPVLQFLVFAICMSLLAFIIWSSIDE